MASVVTEEQIINKLATHCGAIDGIKNAYGFSLNPDSLPSGAIPAIVFYPQSGEQERKGHHNVWMNTFNITGLLFVAQRMSQGGTLKYLENSALVFPQRFRTKFQTASVIEDFIALGIHVADFTKYTYGAGGQLNYMGTDYIGFVMNWTFRSTA